MTCRGWGEDPANRLSAFEGGDRGPCWGTSLPPANCSGRPHWRLLILPAATFMGLALEVLLSEHAFLVSTLIALTAWTAAGVAVLRYSEQDA